MTDRAHTQNASEIPANDVGPARKKKRESKEQRDLREWHERCQRLLKERAPWLSEYETEMLDSQSRYEKAPTDNRREYADLIAYQTQPVQEIEGFRISELIVMVASVKPMLAHVEEEEQVAEWERLRPTRLPRRDAEWLLHIANDLVL